MSKIVTRKRFLFLPERVGGNIKWLTFITEKGTYEPNGYGLLPTGGYLKYKFKKLK